MSNKINVKSEFELYEPMRIWLHRYLEDKYKGFEVITIDAHSERLDRTLIANFPNFTHSMPSDL